MTTTDDDAEDSRTDDDEQRAYKKIGGNRENRPGIVHAPKIQDRDDDQMPTHRETVWGSRDGTAGLAGWTACYGGDRSQRGSFTRGGGDCVCMVGTLPLLFQGLTILRRTPNLKE